MKKKMFFLLTTILILLNTSAWAQASVVIDVTAEKEIVVTENGAEVRKLIPAKEALSGEVLFFTMSYANTGEQLARNVILDNPIPAGMSYLPGTAWGKGADILFSIDQGRTFQKPSLLTYEVVDAQGKTVKRVASAEEYTDIRWVISEIASGDKGQAGFQARVR